MNDQERNQTQREPTRRLQDGHTHAPRRIRACLAVPSVLETDRGPSPSAEREHPLMTEEIRQRLPELYSTANVEDPVIQVRYRVWRFCDWNAIEFDGEDLFFGVVWLASPVWGYFRLSDLETINSSHGGPVVSVDRFFQPVPVSTAIMDYYFY